MAPLDRFSSSGKTNLSHSGADSNVGSTGGILVFLCSPLVLSFLGGMVSSSLIWYSMSQSPREGNDDSGEDDGGDDETATTSPSYWNSMKHDIRVSIDDIKSRIGELPALRRRSRWPWDRRRPRSYFRSDSSSINTVDIDDTSQGGINSSRSPSHSVNSPTAPAELKSDLCIGSIFGVDVGGSLAKLVYFEQKSSTALSTRDSMLGFHHSRERSYRNAASAQAVLVARRGLVRRSSADSYLSEVMSHVASGDIPNSSDDAAEDEASGLHDMGRPASARILRRQRSRSQDALSRTQSDRFHRHRRLQSAREMKHSHQSSEDLEHLNILRQESVPDDLHAYAETVHPLYSPPRASPTGSTLSAPTTQSSPLEKRESRNDLHAAENGRPAGKDHHQNIWRSTGSPGGDGGDAASSTRTDDSLQQMRKSRSMFDLSKSRNRAQALDHFYNFARRLDSYREGVKDDKLSIYSRELGGEFHFIHFETRRMQQAMDLIRTNNLHLNIHEMGATGGGAHKYAHKWQSELGIEMKKQDELDSLVTGMQFVLSSVVGECYSFRPKRELSPKASFVASSTDDQSSSDADVVGAPLEDDDDDDDEAGSNERVGGPKNDNNEEGEEEEEDEVHGKGDEWWWSRKVQRDAISHSATFPYLLVTIGTGVSILRVDGPRKYERISGSTIGGGTYWGLIRLLTDLENFEDVMRLAVRGDPSKVDMMVGDIYGENSDALEKFGLKASLVASSFGKLVAKEDPAAGLKQEDLARALLLMITNNIGQVAYLNAKLTNTRRIYFVGNFLRQNKISQRRLSFAIDYWSKGEMEALFLEHEGYFGALGAFLLSQDIKTEPECAAAADTNGESKRSSSSSSLKPPMRRNTLGEAWSSTSEV